MIVYYVRAYIIGLCERVRTRLGGGGAASCTRSRSPPFLIAFVLPAGYETS